MFLFSVVCLKKKGETKVGNGGYCVSHNSVFLRGERECRGRDTGGECKNRTILRENVA